MVHFTLFFTDHLYAISATVPRDWEFSERREGRVDSFTAKEEGITEL